MTDDNRTDQWWELCATANGDGDILTVGENSVKVCGRVDDLVVVAIPPDRVEAVLNGLPRTLKDAGIDRAIFVPEGVRFVCFRPVPAERAAEIQRRHQQAEQQEQSRREQDMESAN